MKTTSQRMAIHNGMLLRLSLPVPSVCKSTWREVPLLPIHKVGSTTTSSDSGRQATLKTKAYVDDEPLLWPTAGSRFIPISETDENEKVEPEEIEELQGFFVNPIFLSTSSDECSWKVEANVMLEEAVVWVGWTQESYAVVLRVPLPPPQQLPVNRSTTVPFRDLSCRAPIDLVTLLDGSGSMSGAELQVHKKNHEISRRITRRG